MSTSTERTIPAPIASNIEILDPEIAPKAAVELGLTLEEYQGVVATQGRVPSLTELYMYSLMWSEHCAYKHSKKQLKYFPTEGAHVLQGPGENAGVISVGEGWAVAFKMESHNHPSFYDPFAGSATGVGGCVRDIFTMGARPIASLGSLRFGTLDKQRQRELLAGAVAGIGSYGDGLGIPTVGGEVYFEEAYEGNCLINAMSIGVMREEDLTLAVASGAGNYAVYMGESTGRDGIGGASVLASSEFNEKDEGKEHSVPQGNPTLEKDLIEACLELLRAGKFVALSDMGAAGMTCATSEMAGRGGVGIEVDVRAVPQREDGMQPFEVMVSESQERMLAVVKPEDFAVVQETCARWNVPCVRVGTITDTGRFIVRDSQLPPDADIVADIPAEAFIEDAPVYDPAMTRPAYLNELQKMDLSFVYEADEALDSEDAAPYNDALLALLASANICSRAWIYNQCDSEALGNTIIAPGSDAAVIRIGDASRGGLSNRGIATSTDCNGRYCYLDPYIGAQIALAESMRNLACVGAEPAAITDCLNFGNPEKPEVFYTFHKAVRGLAAACEFFGVPVISGNVSFYNESYGKAIYPTPAIGIVGVIEDVSRVATSTFKKAGDTIILVGETLDEMGGSEYLKLRHGVVGGIPPVLNLELEGDVQNLVRDAVCCGLLASAHDCSEGGVAIALAESCIAGGLGATLALDDDLPGVASLFSESQSRIVISVADENVEVILDMLAERAVPYSVIGEVGGDRFVIEGKVDVALDEIAAIYCGSLEKYVCHRDNQ
ncbi:MAG: phosphoribosylformylglycinamidine synthase subunit PurL [Coriobacteriia bacterium]|nr:phosphoribosylformylglycinamidine synthase subunit PurL [Coriobacteriia bacterium]